MGRKIRVLVVDDSALVRQMLTEMFSATRDIEVVGTAPDPYVAREKIKQLKPDVITLDVEMPRMDGLTFLDNLMRLHPMPVVMVSSLTEKGADVTLHALELGAVDFVSKPRVDLANTLDEYAEEIAAKVRMAAGVRIAARERSSALDVTPKLSADAVIARRSPGAARFRTTDKIVAIGASTGGTEAIKEVLARLPADAPGTVITQHIPEAFSGAFARRMDSCSAMTVAEARDGAPVMPGHAFIAPGNRHLMVVRDGARFLCRLNDGPPVNRHRPSVDVLFRSVAQSAGINAVGVLLTGMGADGAEGLNEMHLAGAHTMAQDERTSIVWGMPGEAVRRGAADEVVPIESVAERILRAAAAGAGVKKGAGVPITGEQP